MRLPEGPVPLRPGGTLRLGDRGARIIHTPGHSGYHFVLHDEDRSVLFAGDHLLLKVTPNIGLWTYTAPRPLRRYTGSLEGLNGLGMSASSSRVTARSSTTCMPAYASFSGTTRSGSR